MSLGFNNQPVSWDNSRIILSDRSGENYAAAITSAAQSVGQGILGYAQKQEQKQREQDAVQVLKQYGPQLGLNTTDDKALLAGVKSVGADTLLKLAKQGQDIHEEQASAKAFLAELGYDTSAMGGSDAVSIATGEQTKAKHAYNQALAAQATAAAGAAERKNRQSETDAAVLKQLVGAGKPLTADNYFSAGGTNTELADTLVKLAGKPAFTPTSVTMPDGTVMLQTSPQSFVPSPASRLKVPTTPEEFTVGPAGYTKIGNRFFETATGKPVQFVSSKGDPLAEIQRQQGEAEIGNLRAQIAEDQTALAQGDTRTGLLNYKSRESRIQENIRKLAAAQARLGGAGAAPAAQPLPANAQPQPSARPAQFQSPAAVKAAMASGQLTREQAIQILQQQFGMQ